MVLANYVRLDPGVPTRMHFTDDYWIDRRIAERESGGSKRVRGLVFQVDELEGEDTARTFSVLSQKLQAALQPYLKDQLYLKYDLIITKMGEGFLTDFNVQAILRPE